MVLPLICTSSALFHHCLQVAWKCRRNASAHTFASCILEGSLAALLRFTHVQLAFFVAGAALCEPQSADFVAGTALCEPPCADVVAGTALCEPRCADVVAGTALHTSATCIFVRNAFWKHSGCTKCCVFAYEMLLRRGSSAERRLPDGLAPWSDRFRSGTVVSGVRGVCQVLQISWQAQHFVNLNVQIQCRFRGRRSTL